MDYGKLIYERWAETFVIVLMLVGFFIALLLNSALLSYFVIIIAGFLAGRFYFSRRLLQPILPFVLIIIGFLIGFMLGAIWANKTIIVILFVASSVGSYYLHQKGYLGFFKTAGFIK